MFLLKKCCLKLFNQPTKKYTLPYTIESSSKDLPQIYHRFTTNLPRIYQRFTTNKKIFSILLSKYLPRIYHRFTTNLPRIYQRFTKSTKHLPTAYQQLPKYFFNLPRIYHRFTNTILELNIFVLELSIVKDDVLLT